MNKFFLIILLALVFNATPTFAATETVKIYPTDDGTNVLTEQDGITDWFLARNFSDLLSKDPNIDSVNISHRSDRQIGVYSIFRTSSLFDTSVIPSDSSIQSVSLNVFKINYGVVPTDVVFTSHQRSSTTLLQKQDWQISNYGQEIARGDGAINDYLSLDFNSFGLSYINKDGYTVIGGMTSFDYDNNDPGFAQTGIAFASSEAPGTSTDPYLEVTYTVPDDPEEPLTLPELVEDLVEKVETGDLSKSQKNSYRAHLKKVENMFSSGQLIAAKNQIEQFMSKVRKDLIKGNITFEDGEELLESAEAILEIINTILNTPNSSEVPLITQIASLYPPESADWESDIFGNGTPDWCGNTIGGCGCAITSLAMLAHHQDVTTGLDGSEINPRNLNNWLIENNGYTPANTVIWNYALQYFSSQKGTSYFSLDHHNATDRTLIDQYVNDGQLALAFKRSKGHYFVLTDVLAGGQYGVNDPFWYLTETTNDLKDTANHVQNYGGSIDQANLFSFTKNLRSLPKWVEIHLGSPAELLITDSQGRRAGFDPVTEEVVLEIPGSSYGQSEGVVTADEVREEVHLEKVLMILPPEDDSYTLEVIGTGEGDYDLTIATNGSGASTEIEKISSSTSLGHVDSFVVDIPNADENSGHGNDDDGCDEDNSGIGEQCS